MVKKVGIYDVGLVVGDVVFFVKIGVKDVSSDVGVNLIGIGIMLVKNDLLFWEFEEIIFGCLRLGVVSMSWIVEEVE